MVEHGGVGRRRRVGVEIRVRNSYAIAFRSLSASTHTPRSASDVVTAATTSASDGRLSPAAGSAPAAPRRSSSHATSTRSAVDE